MELAATRLFQPKWTNQIQGEWISALLRKRPELASRLERTRALMDAAVLDCLVEDYEYLIPSLECPDPNDRHVIAAAIKAGCSAIVTFNLKHFPPDLLVKYHIEPLHPDEFVHRQLARDRTAVLSAARRCRLRLKAPQMSQEEYLRRLEIQSLSKTVADLSGYSSMI